MKVLILAVVNGEPLRYGTMDINSQLSDARSLWQRSCSGGTDMHHNVSPCPGGLKQTSDNGWHMIKPSQSLVKIHKWSDIKHVSVCLEGLFHLTAAFWGTGEKEAQSSHFLQITELHDISPFRGSRQVATDLKLPDLRLEKLWSPRFGCMCPFSTQRIEAAGGST